MQKAKFQVGDNVTFRLGKGRPAAKVERLDLTEYPDGRRRYILRCASGSLVTRTEDALARA